MEKGSNTQQAWNSATEQRGRTAYVCVHKDMAGPEIGEDSLERWRQRKYPIPKPTKRDKIVEPRLESRNLETPTNITSGLPPDRETLV